MKYLFSLLAVFAVISSSFAASQDYQSKVNYDTVATVSLAVSSTTSNAVDLHGTQLVGIFVPSTFDGTQITFAVASAPGGTYLPVDIDNTSANPYVVTTAASKYAPITNPDVFRGARYLQVIASTNQSTTDTIFNLATRPVQ